jgi:hypothetical protein
MAFHYLFNIKLIMHVSSYSQNSTSQNQSSLLNVFMSLTSCDTNHRFTYDWGATCVYSLVIHLLILKILRLT